MKKNNAELIISTVVIIILSVALAVLFTTQKLPREKENPIQELKDSKKQLQELNDRSDDGICVDMYAEGFEWGLAQYKIYWQTEHWHYPEEWNKQQRAMAWYEAWEEITKDIDLTN